MSLDWRTKYSFFIASMLNFIYSVALLSYSADAGRSVPRAMCCRVVSRVYSYYSPRTHKFNIYSSNKLEDGAVSVEALASSILPRAGV